MLEKVSNMNLTNRTKKLKGSVQIKIAQQQTRETNNKNQQNQNKINREKQDKKKKIINTTTKII